MADEEDLYDFDVPFDASEVENDADFQQALKTSTGKRPTTTARLATGMAGSRPGTQTRTGLRTAAPGTAGMRGMTAMGRTSSTGDSRPMTAVKGAGYSSGAGTPGLESARPLLETHKPDTPEEKIRQLEVTTMDLIEESCLASCRNDGKLALDKAKEASTKERTLIRQRDQAGLSDQHNMELTFLVLTNLANQYAKNDLYTEALNTYTVITKNKSFNNPGRLKVNMGNIYYKMEQYPKALKFYRMAMDQVPSGQKSTKIKIMHNIGILFVKMGRYADAITSFEYCMHEKASFRTGLHLVVCYQAMGERQKQRDAFEKLLQVPFNMEKDDHYKDLEEEAEKDPQTALVVEVIKNDPMRKLERRLRNEAEQCILTASKLISTAGSTPAEVSQSYDWCLETLKNSQHADLASDLEINKAVMYLRRKDFKAAIDTLRVFDKVETKVASHAFTNLAFLYFLRREFDEAERYALQARDADSYNAPALVNLGNCCLQRGDLHKAKEYYICALDNDASCVQALYNLGLVDKQLRLYQQAKDSFVKLHMIVRSHPQIIYQIANCYELLGDVDQATEWYVQMLSLVPTDPDTLFHLGGLFDREGDKQGAYQYFFDSSRFYPSNLEVIDWLGSYFIEHQVSEKAIMFFERAALIQPAEVRWHLMVASCLRRAGNYQRALAKYKEIHTRFPDNVESEVLGPDLHGPGTEGSRRLRQGAEEGREVERDEGGEDERQTGHVVPRHVRSARLQSQSGRQSAQLVQHRRTVRRRHTPGRAHTPAAAGDRRQVQGPDRADAAADGQGGQGRRRRLGRRHRRRPAARVARQGVPFGRSNHRCSGIRTPAGRPARSRLLKSDSSGLLESGHLLGASLRASTSPD